MDDTARRQAIAALSPDAFENLVHAVVVAHEPDGDLVRKLRPPDGGADTLILRPDGSVRLVVQAKRYNQRVNWAKCSESLSRAVARWQPDAVRFVFSQDFTERQLASFERYFSPRTGGPQVLAWTLSDLAQLLDEHPSIGPRFFGPDWRSITATVARATRLGGSSLSTAKDLVARAGELGRFGDELDPNYIYGVAAVPTGGPRPDWEDYPAITIETVVDSATVHVAMWPRQEEEGGRRTPRFKNDAIGKLVQNQARRALAKGEAFRVLPDFLLSPDILLSPIRPTPKIVDEFEGEIEWWIHLKPSKPLPILLVCESPYGPLELALAVYAIPPHEGYWMAFASLRDGLWVELGFPHDFENSGRLWVYMETDFGPAAVENLRVGRALQKFASHTSFRVIGPVDFGIHCDSGQVSADFLSELENKIADFEIAVDLEDAFGERLPFPMNGPTVQDRVALRVAQGLLKQQGGTLRETTETVVVSPADLLDLTQAAGAAGVRTFPVKVEIFGIVLDFGLGHFWSQGMSVAEISPLSHDPGSPARVTLQPVNNEVIEWRLEAPIGNKG